MNEEKQLENQEKVKMPWQIKACIGFCFVINIGILVKSLLFGFNRSIDIPVFIVIFAICFFLYLHLEISYFNQKKINQSKNE